MIFELSVSFLVSGLIFMMAFFARKSLLSMSMVSSAVFGTMLIFLKYAFDANTYSIEDWSLVKSYGVFLFFTFGTFLYVRLVKDTSLVAVRDEIKSRSSGILLAIILYALLWLVRGVIGFVYGVAFSGSANTAVLSFIPYWLIITNSLLSIVGMGAFVLLVKSGLNSKSKYFILIIIAELVWAFMTGGRRGFLFTSIFIIMILYFSGYLRIKGITILSSMMIILVYSLTPVFLVIRDNNAQNQIYGYDAITSLKNATADAFSECGLSGACNELIAGNIQARGNTLEFTKNLVVAKNEMNYPFLYGEAFLTSVAWAMPSFLIQKPDYMVEQFIQSKFGMEIRDDAVSIPFVAYSDLGLFGCFIAGLLFAAGSSYVLKYSLGKNKIIFYGVLFSVVKMFLNIESDPLVFFVLMRDLVILNLAAFVVGALTNIRRITS